LPGDYEYSDYYMEDYSSSRYGFKQQQRVCLRAGAAGMASSKPYPTEKQVHQPKGKMMLNNSRELADLTERDTYSLCGIAAVQGNFTRSLQDR
jgi:hypothetical protein